MLPVNSLTPALAEQGQSPQRGSSPNPQGSRLCWPRRLAGSPWNPGETDRHRETEKRQIQGQTHRWGKVELTFPPRGRHEGKGFQKNPLNDT